MIAYLDASSGAMLMAAVAGGAAGIAVLFRLYWHRFLGIFSKKHRAHAEDTFGELMGKQSPDS
jgi:hypothetical protein